MNNILTQELKRQRVKPEMIVQRDYLPFVLIVAAVACYSQGVSLGLTSEC